jgi:hypothetical protein
MMLVLAEVLVALAPFLLIAALLRVVDHVGRRRDARCARQIAVTDAIHREMGAVVAPVVRRGADGRWRVEIAVPFDRPGTVAAIVRITDRVFGRERYGEPFRLMLTPATASVWPRAIRPAPLSAALGRSAAAAR